MKIMPARGIAGSNWKASYDRVRRFSAPLIENVLASLNSQADAIAMRFPGGHRNPARDQFMSSTHE